MSPKQVAIRDIKESLRNEERVFLAFRTELNKPIKQLVKNQLNAQKHLKQNTMVDKCNSQLIAQCIYEEKDQSVTLINFSAYYGRK